MFAFHLKQTAIVTVLLTGFLSQPSFAAGAKISAELQSVHPADSVDVMVEYTAESNSRPAIDRMSKLRRFGAVSKGYLSSVRSEVVTITGRDVASLADDPDVVAIRPDRQSAVHFFQRHSRLFMDSTGAQAAGVNGGLDGKGIGVAVIDSGIDEHL